MTAVLVVCLGTASCAPSRPAVVHEPMPGPAPGNHVHRDSQTPAERLRSAEARISMFDRIIAQMQAELAKTTDPEKRRFIEKRLEITSRVREGAKRTRAEIAREIRASGTLMQAP